MRTDRFHYELPPELIAQEPAARREDARLLVWERRSNQRRHSSVAQLGDFLREGDVLVFNEG
jgi:S-adenosylmethionine:tRNA ribosyltransferase-isomerase